MVQEDAAQHALASLLALGTPPEHPWFFVRDRARSEIRRYRPPAEPAVPAVDGASSPEARAIARQEWDAVQACMGCLTPLQQRVIELTMIGHGPTEIGRILVAEGRSESPSRKNVAAIKRQARANLIRCIGRSRP